MRGHMLEVELNTLDPKSFDNIQDLFTKFKYLILNLSCYPPSCTMVNFQRAAKD
jgi:hypothetical protein